MEHMGTVTLADGEKSVHNDAWGHTRCSERLKTDMKSVSQMGRRITAIAFFAIMCSAQTALAQQEVRTATVLAFDTADGMEELGTAYYNMMRTQVETHPSYLLNDLPEQRLDDMLLAIGCAVLDAECADTVRSLVGSDLLIHGELRRDGTYSAVVITMYDLEAQRELRTRSHVLTGGDNILRDRSALFARSILYGNDGRLVVDSTTPNTSVFVNDDFRGIAPVEIDTLALGMYTVRLESEGFQSRTEVAPVDLGDNRYSWTLTSAAVARTQREPSDGFGAAPYVVLGVGVAILGGGIGVGVAKNSTQNDFDSLLAGDVFDRNEAEELRDRGRRQAALSNALLGVGGVAIATGVVLLIVDNTRAEPARTTASTTRERGQSVRFAPAFTRYGPGFDLDVRF